MKHFLLILLLIIIITLNAQQWTNISPFPASNRSVRGNFISEEEGWIFQLGMYISRDIYYTEDGGDNWEIIYSLEDPLEFILSLQMIDNQNGWMHKKWQDNLYPYENYESYLKTTDGGYSWEYMTDYLPELDYIGSFYFINQDIGFIEAGSDNVSYQALIYKTIDGGENWYLTNTPIVYFPYPNYVNYSTNKFFFIDENNGWAACSAFAGSGLSIYTSDGGENWDVGVEPGLSPDLFDIHFTDINSGGVVGHNGSIPFIRFTEDNFETFSFEYGATNWNQLSQAICFQNDSTVWISGSPGIINRSTNRGATFEVFQTINSNVTSIQFFNNTGFIFGSQNGLFKFVDPVGIGNDFMIQAKDFNVKVYPNPFNPITTISFTTYEESEVEIIIYNIKGQKIGTLLDNDFLIGDYTINWNGRSNNREEVSSGLYLCRLRIGDRTIIKKLMMIK